MNLKRLSLLIAACCLLPLAAHADLIKQSGTYQRTVLMTDATDHVTGKTGLTLSITLSKAGAAYTSITPTITETGNGIYSITLATGNTGTLGALDMHITATGADPSDTHDQVVGFDPASDLGASALAGIGTTTTAISAKLGTPAGASVSADIAALGTSVASLPTLNAIVNGILGFNLFPSYTLQKGLQDIWSVNAGSSTATYPTSTQQVTHYLQPDGATPQTGSTLNTTTAGKPTSRIKSSN